ncbi:MAG: hypothetical protein JF606_25565 [Burkholderiales bacterium]|jgi:hypothetical protein|nr:hypothetical protein [Burkholderiales bacterium]
MPTSKTSRKAGVVRKNGSAKKTTTAATKRTVTKKPSAAADALRGGTSLAKAKPEALIQALLQLGNAVLDDRDAFNGVMRILGDTAADHDLRNKVLSSVQGLTFDPVRFAPHRPAYMKTLRALRTDANSELRQRAFGLLARENDPDTQAMLISGLEDAGKAMLPPEKALQLLSYDPHAGAYAVAHKIEQAPPNPLARREALRVLAADAGSVKLFEQVLGDKSESTEVRQLAASALNHLAPKRMQDTARGMAMDPTESDEIKTLCLTALANFGDPEVLAQDTELQAQVERYQGDADDASSLKLAAANLKQRYT